MEGPWRENGEMAGKTGELVSELGNFRRGRARGGCRVGQRADKMYAVARSGS